MDATVQAALVNGVTTMQTSAFIVLAAVLVPAMVLLTTPALLKKGIKWFRGIAHI